MVRMSMHSAGHTHRAIFRIFKLIRSPIYLQTMMQPNQCTFTISLLRVCLYHQEAFSSYVPNHQAYALHVIHPISYMLPPQTQADLVIAKALLAMLHVHHAQDRLMGCAPNAKLFPS